jgi:hypothetical protein
MGDFLCQACGRAISVGDPTGAARLSGFIVANPTEKLW